VKCVFGKSSNTECAKKITNVGSLLLAYAWTASKLWPHVSVSAILLWYTGNTKRNDYKT
jgi:hypothetical protein